MVSDNLYTLVYILTRKLFYKKVAYTPYICIYIYIKYIYMCVCDCIWLEIFPIQLCCKTGQFSQYIVDICSCTLELQHFTWYAWLVRLATSIRYTTEGCATFFKTTRFKRLDKAIFDYDKLSQQELGSNPPVSRNMTKHERWEIHLFRNGHWNRRYGGVPIQKNEHI